MAPVENVDWHSEHLIQWIIFMTYVLTIAFISTKTNCWESIGKCWKTNTKKIRRSCPLISYILLVFGCSNDFKIQTITTSNEIGWNICGYFTKLSQIVMDSEKCCSNDLLELCFKISKRFILFFFIDQKCSRERLRLRLIDWFHCI